MVPESDTETRSRILAMLTDNRLDDAKRMCSNFCQNRQSDTSAWELLAQINSRLGDMQQVVHCCQQLISLQPDNGASFYNLGTAYMSLGNLDEARIAFERSRQLSPQHVPTYFNLGNVYMRLGMLESAIESLEGAIKIAPHLAELYNSYAAALQQAGKYSEAEASYRSAIRLKPSFPMAHNNLASVLFTQDRLSEAVESYRHALEIDPAFADAHFGLGLVLTQLGDMRAALDCFRKTLNLNPHHAIAHSCLLFTLNYDPAINQEDLAVEHFRWGEIHEKRVPALTLHRNGADAGRQLRIGYISPDFRNHSVSYFVKSFLGNHNAEEVEAICYSDVLHPDSVTEQLRGLAGKWRDTYGLSDEKLAQKIMDDSIDILVDLAGHTAGNRLMVFARKPAPLQVSYLGYPNTTGLRAMDYRITDAWADPPGMTEHLYTEKLLRLPRGFLCYSPPADSPEVTLLPVASSGHITFGSFNMLAKMTPAVVELWAQVLDAVPESRLILKNKSLSTEKVREQFQRMFASHGIAPERLELLHWSQSLVDHLSLYGRIDIALDTHPYNGTTTTCEALWMGIPVITLAGSVHAARVGCSILSQLGLTDMIAKDPEAYVSLAEDLACDRGRLAHLREELRVRMGSSSLMDAKGFCQDLETAYRDIWKIWMDCGRDKNQRQDK